MPVANIFQSDIAVIKLLNLNCVLVKAVFMPIPFSSLLGAVYYKD